MSTKEMGKKTVKTYLFSRMWHKQRVTARKQASKSNTPLIRIAEWTEQFVAEFNNPFSSHVNQFRTNLYHMHVWYFLLKLIR